MLEAIAPYPADGNSATDTVRAPNEQGGLPLYTSARSVHPVIHMIGELVGEMTGRVVEQRLVRHRGGEPRIERFIESKGKVLGTEITVTATFRSKERLPGGMFLKGDGL